MYICVCAAVPQLGSGLGLLDSSPQRSANGAWPGAGPLVQPGGGAARESSPNEGDAEGTTNKQPPLFKFSLPAGLRWTSVGVSVSPPLSPLQVLDTQLAVCRRAPGDADGDVGGDDVIPRWVPSHLDIRQRSAFSM